MFFLTFLSKKLPLEIDNNELDVLDVYITACYTIYRYMIYGELIPDSYSLMQFLSLIDKHSRLNAIAMRNERLLSRFPSPS